MDRVIALALRLGQMPNPALEVDEAELDLAQIGDGLQIGRSSSFIEPDSAL
jgi:hypothetical protein